MNILLGAGADIIGEIAKWLTVRDLINVVSSSKTLRKKFLHAAQKRKAMLVMRKVLKEVGNECLKALRLGGSYVPRTNLKTMMIKPRTLYGFGEFEDGMRIIFDIPNNICIHDIEFTLPDYLDEYDFGIVTYDSTLWSTYKTDANFFRDFPPAQLHTGDSECVVQISVEEVDEAYKYEHPLVLYYTDMKDPKSGHQRHCEHYERYVADKNRRMVADQKKEPCKCHDVCNDMVLLDADNAMKIIRVYGDESKFAVWGINGIKSISGENGLYDATRFVQNPFHH